MRKVKELKYTQVYKTCDLRPLKFKTTEDLTPCRDYIGQDRAVDAINFGLGMEFTGYNLYLAGPPGVGKKTTIETILSLIAKDKPSPKDWCYVFNFQDPNAPKAIELPKGKGKELKIDMEEFLQDLKIDIPRAFESKEFEEQKQNTMNQVQREKNDLFEKLQKKANESEIQVQFSPTGIITIPLIKGKPVTQENYNSLDEETKKKIKASKEKIDTEVAEVLKVARKLERHAGEKVKELEKKVALFSVRDLIEIIRDKYKSYPQVIDYFDQLQKHILENIDNFLPAKGPQATALMQMPMRMPQQETTFTEYKVNVLIDNSNTQGAPVIFESHPTYTNLFGSIEKEARFGALVTDFTMIRSGSLAKANGGYLVLDALDLFKYPFVWDSLKKAIENGELIIEDVYQQYGFSSTVGIKPEPVKLDVKVIIAGNSQLYHMLYAYDEDFRKLFKVKADFDYIVNRNDSTLSQYSCFIKSVCDMDGLNKFDRSGVETVIEYSSRLAGDQNKLSVQFGSITKILKEANYWARIDNNSKSIKRQHVEKAIDEKIYRSNMIEEKIQEMIAKGSILVDTEGLVVGQINGLAVYNIGDYAFGKPSRLTCETYMGTEGLINIDRRAKLSGNIHDKGVFILSGYLGSTYAQKKPLSLSASIGFEQSYDVIDGDSASTAELVVLLSSLSGIPIKQSFAITGSINQKGQIQPIGGVNEKVEGFYDVCKAKGLNGEQGVIIPHQNVKNLMLRKEVVQAVKDKKFHIYPIESVDQAIELLTGKEAGKKGSTGKFKTGTVNYLVDKKLKEFAEDYRKFGRQNTNMRKGNGSV
ncbi:MAG: ATP-dependent protease [Thermodesulfobacteriota bacterium]|nr:MAG: ATP-dependent protease [Thermodesulfobacteriota bacterium]